MGDVLLLFRIKYTHREAERENGNSCNEFLWIWMKFVWMYKTGKVAIEPELEVIQVFWDVF